MAISDLICVGESVLAQQVSIMTGKESVTPSGTTIKPIFIELGSVSPKSFIPLMHVAKRVTSLDCVKRIARVYARCTLLKQRFLTEWLTVDSSKNITHHSIQKALVPFDILGNSKHFSTELQRLRALYETARSLQEVHEAGYVHKDIRASNLFYDPSTDSYGVGDVTEAEAYNPSLGCKMKGLPDVDYPPEILSYARTLLKHKVSICASRVLLFNWSIAQEKNATHPRVTTGTLTEKRLERAHIKHGRIPFSQKADIYALGHTFYKLFQSHGLWKTKEPATLLEEIIWEMIHPDPEMRPTLGDVITRLGAEIKTILPMRETDYIFLNRPHSHRSTPSLLTPFRP